MFDVGFFELILISIVALFVLGPDRLPGAIRTLGLWIGRLRRSFNNVKREIEQEIGADEIRRQLRNEAIMEKFNSTKQQFSEGIDSVKKETESLKDDLNLKKELSGFTGEGEEEKEKSTEKKDGQSPVTDPNSPDYDPVEALSTNDPTVKSARKPTTASDAGTAPASGGQTGTQTDSTGDTKPAPASPDTTDAEPGGERDDSKPSE